MVKFVVFRVAIRREIFLYFSSPYKYLTTLVSSVVVKNFRKLSVMCEKRNRVG